MIEKKREVKDDKIVQKILEPFFDVNVVISDESMYQVCGTRKA